MQPEYHISNVLNRVPAVDLPDARGWFKMVVLVEVGGRFFLREGVSHSEGLRRLLGEFSAAGLEIEETNSLRGQWKAGSWAAGTPVLQIRPSDSRRGEAAIWAQFFRQNPLGVSVSIEASLAEVRDD